MSDALDTLERLSDRRRELFEMLVQESKKHKTASAAQVIPRRPDDGPCALSFAQQRVWLFDRIEPDSSAYNLAGAFRIRGSLNRVALEQSLNEIFRRHEILRTVFLEIDGQPLQVPSRHQALPLSMVDLCELPEPGKQDKAYDLAYAEAQRPFNLSQGPLVRATLLRLASQDHVFAVILHHIISDGWSIGILVREMSALYGAVCAGRESPLSDLPIQYADFALWQQQWLQGDKLQKQLAYWRRHLNGAATALELPTSRPRPAVQSRGGSNELRLLPKALSESLKELSRTEGVTLFMVLLTAFKVLLHRYTGQDDIIVGTPIANRNRVETHELIGFFVNTLALRTDLSGNPTYTDALARVREVALGAYANQDTPFERLVEELRPERDVSRPPLFQVMFVLHNNDIPLLELSGLELTPLALHSGAVNFDLVMGIEDSPQGMRVLLEYSTALFDVSTIVRMLEQFQQLLESIATDPTQRIQSLKLLSEAERNQVLVEWNSTSADYPGDACIHELIEAQAERTPDATAVVFGDERLSYSQLNRRANRLASRLRREGVTPDSLVGICVERSIGMIVALLGVLKAGGAYVPLDPMLPKDRIASILEDSSVSVLLTEKWWSEQFADVRALLICLDADWPTIAEEEGASLSRVASPENLAYVIYTSGSTGRPKGVQVSHRAVVNFLFSMRREPGLDERDRLLSVTTLTFDIAGLELYLPLISGACVILASREETVDAEQLKERIAASEATIMQATPATWRMLLEAGWAGNKQLKALCGGEAFEKDLAKQLIMVSKEVWNLYGPTETTIWSSCHKITSADASVLIGRPIANTKIHLIGDCMEPVPIGVFGELHIGGDGLARGYLNRADLTAERFIPDPFNDEPGSRLYKTGDLARYMPDGNIEFFGRIDHQVKLRGFRIELEEIEAVIAEHAAVRKAVVIAREDTPGDKRLVAYLIVRQKSMVEEPRSGAVVPPLEEEPSPANHQRVEVDDATARYFEPDSLISNLRRLLREKLPEYMVPSAFVILDELPLTPNGKLDRRALPAPDIRTLNPEANFEAPRTEIEQAIAEIWQQALHLDRVGLRDNFFDIGGHSLLLVKIHSQLRKISNRSLSALDLFRYPTISALAEFINQGEDGKPIQKQIRGKVETGKHILEQQRSDIAIIGMAGRFPGAADTEAFWENLRDGVESIKPFSEEMLMAAGVDPSVLKDPNYVNAGAALDGIEMFDAAFFGFNPKEVEVMDPQHRIFLECSWEALENAGYNSETYPGRIGVYAGANMSGYLLNLLSNRGVMDGVWNFQTLLGNDKDFLPTRVSYKLNLKGPSLSVQTACSTSLVAVHLACKSLLDTECDMALAGGVSISHLEKAGYFYQEGSILSPDGHCRAFDARAKGTVFGSGIGIVVLKRLSDAVAEGDNVLAVIKATAVNNDGSSKIGYTAPSISGQVDVISRAQSLAGIAPETVTYIETHGTGTELGDPIEIAALTEVFRAATDRKRFCAIGSVKTNVGHLDAAAGVTGLIKTVLALRHQMLPPSLHFVEPNPKIDFENSPFYVNSDLRDWESKGPRRAAVSSFGIGGTNSHVLLEEAPKRDEQTDGRSTKVLVLSARTSTALDTATSNLLGYLKRNPEVALADVEYTLNAGRKAFDHRRVIVCHKVDDAIDKIERTDSRHILTSTHEPRQRPIFFMFPGQGSQYLNMGLSQYEQEPVFRQEIDRCSLLLKDQLGFDLRGVIYPRGRQVDETAETLNQTFVTQPAIFVIEYALSQLWSEWGVRPNMMIGHSIGEYVAACLAGVFSLEDALSVVAARAKLIQSLPAGAMLAVPLPEEDVHPLLGDGLWFAAVNGPALCTVSGTTEAVANLEDRLRGRGISCSRLSTSHAFHSGLLDPILASFADIMKRIELKPPQIPYLSNVTGRWISESEATNPHYWVRHLRETVRFGDCLSESLKKSQSILLEVGPGRTLSGLATRHPSRQAEQLILTSLRRSDSKDSEAASMRKALGQLWLAGAEVDWAGFYAHQRRYRVPLPTYPFERQRYWIEARKEWPSDGLKTTPKKKLDVADWFYVPVWKRSVTTAKAGQPHDTDRGKPWLVFKDPRGLGLRMAKQLEAQHQSAILVVAGQRYSQTSDGVFTINHEQREDYSALIENLRSTGRAPRTIIHLLGLTAAESFEDDVTGLSALRRIILLVQALREHGLATMHGDTAQADPIEIIVASTNMHAVSGQENLRPENAAVLGACKVIPQEYSNLTCRVLDVGVTEPDTRQERKLIGQIIEEANARPASSIVAYRGIHRWVQAIEAVRLNDESRKARLEKGGTYLITGALDGMAYEICQYLARIGRSKLILVEPSTPSDNRNRVQCQSGNGNQDDLRSRANKLEALRAAGAEMFVFSADITSVPEMLEVAKRSREEIGEIDGVFQATEPAAGGLIQLQNPEELDRALSPVIKGAQVLDVLFRESRVKFIALCSLAHSIIGEVGRMNHCATHSFLESFAYRNAMRTGPFTLALSLDPPLLNCASGNCEMTAESPSLEDCVNALRLLTACDLPYVIASARDLPVLIEHNKMLLSTGSPGMTGVKMPAVSTHARPETGTEYVAPTSEIEHTISAIWEKLLGIDRVGVYDDFFELGGHSLIAINVLSEIREIFAVQAPMASLFEAPTVSELAVMIETLKERNAGSTVPIVPVSRQAYRMSAKSSGLMGPAKLSEKSE